MLKLRKLDLQVTFMRSRTLRKDIQNKACSIEHATFKHRFEVTFLTGTEIVVKDHQLSFVMLNPLIDLFRFT